MAMNTSVLDYAKTLISRPSVTPDDQGCQEFIAEKLAPLGFTNEPMPFGEVKNLWSRRGKNQPLLVFAGHTDVVPPGPRESWDSDPFTPTIRDGKLYGRGSCDMKSSIAAMMVACEQFIAETPDPAIDLAFLITSDEEGPAVNGTVKVVETLAARQEHIDWALVGEPSSKHTVGDVVKNGRRGSLNGVLTVHGVQGHVAYPDTVVNPVHQALVALDKLATRQWDAGNDYFPPTSFQISNIKAGTGAENVTPGSLEVMFNFRFSTASTAESLQQQVREVLEAHHLNYDISWRLSGNPFLTPDGVLVQAAREAIQKTCNIDTTLSTSGGTSDGRFIARGKEEVMELGPVNATIHQANEHIDVAQLEDLVVIYYNILNNLDNHARS
jgi:succinyl-diaminopimelate desuccinylase